MKTPHLVAALALLVPAVPLLAQIEDEVDRVALREGRIFYFAVFAGITFPMDGTFTVNSDLTLPDASTPNQLVVESDSATRDFVVENGFTGSLAVGLYLGPFRAEVELGTHWSDMETLLYTLDNDDVELNYSLTPAEDYSVRLGSEFIARRIMANFFWDFPLLNEFYGYLGIGAGISEVSLDGGDLGDFTSDVLFSGQALAGVIFPLSEAVDVIFGYRLYAVEDFEITADISQASNPPVTNRGPAGTGDTPITGPVATSIEVPLIHSIEVGFRFSF